MTDTTPDPMSAMGTVSPSGVRYFPDGRRTFEPGHMVRMTHGANIPRVVAPVAEWMEDALDALVEGTPAAGDSFAAARGTLAVRLARLHLLRTYIDEHHGGLPLNPETGAVLDIARQESALLNSVDRSLAELGLTPASAAKLGVDLLRGGSLAQEMQAALDARARADARMSTIPDARATGNGNATPEEEPSNAVGQLDTDEVTP